MKLESGSLITDVGNTSEPVNFSEVTSAQRGGSVKRHLKSFTKSAGPLLLMIAASGFAHAAPSIDMSGVTSVMQTVETACLLIGSIIVLISLIFSVFSFAGGNVMRGITGVAGVLFGGLVIGLGPTWVSSLTGQSV